LRRLSIGLVGIAALLALASNASAAAFGYVWPSIGWSYGQSASSQYDSVWKDNWFQKSAPGYDTVATLIDNTSYSWHGTVRNTFQVTMAQWQSSAVKKAYVRSYASGFTGNCLVWG
jgi:ABC-type sugar transport system substrate-binding protein